MSAYSNSTYQFNINDDNFIRVLATTVGNLGIVALEPNFGVNISRMRMRDLPVVIKRIKSSSAYLAAPQTQLTVNSSFKYTQSLATVFPAFVPSPVKTTTPQLQTRAQQIADRLQNAHEAFGGDGENLTFDTLTKAEA